MYTSIDDLSTQGSGGSRAWAPLILGKKEEMTEGRKASRASKTPPPPPLAQGLDPPLVYELAMALLGSLMASVLQVNNAQ